MVIFQEEVDGDAYKVESILLGRKRCQNLIICLFIGVHLVHADHLMHSGQIDSPFEKKFMDVHQVECLLRKNYVNLQ